MTTPGVAAGLWGSSPEQQAPSNMRRLRSDIIESKKTPSAEEGVFLRSEYFAGEFRRSSIRPEQGCSKPQPAE